MTITIENNNKLVCSMLLAMLALGAAMQTAVADASEPLRTLAFGSCNRGHLPQPLWPVIESHQPDLFLWTGDAVYADTIDPAIMQAKYDQQLELSGYQQFISKVPVIGIWDDHDYGINDGGKENPIKKDAQRIFLDFLGEPQDSIRRTREGVYYTRTYGTGSQQVKIFMFDTRYHRDASGRGRSDILGDAQWRWLENEIKNSTAAINLMVSSISVLSRQFPVAEEWRDFKWSRKKLFALINKYKLPGVLFLTGDRHFSAHLTARGNRHKFHEFMSSGLTHYLRRKAATRVFNLAYGEKNTFFGRNFSKLTIHWERQPLAMTFEVFDTENKLQLEKTVKLQRRFWR